MGSMIAMLDTATGGLDGQHIRSFGVAIAFTEDAQMHRTTAMRDIPIGSPDGRSPRRLGAVITLTEVAQWQHCHMTVTLDTAIGKRGGQLPKSPGAVCDSIVAARMQCTTAAWDIHIGCQCGLQPKRHGVVITPIEAVQFRHPMTVMLALPTGEQDGQMTKSTGVASTLTGAAPTCLMTAMPATPIGIMAGLMRRSIGAAIIFIGAAVRKDLTTALPATAIGRRVGPTARSTGAANTSRRAAPRPPNMIVMQASPTGSEAGHLPRSTGAASMVAVDVPAA